MIHALSPFLAMLSPLDSRLTVLDIEGLEGMWKKEEGEGKEK